MALKQGVKSPRAGAKLTRPLRTGQRAGIALCALLLSACASQYRGGMPGGNQNAGGTAAWRDAGADY